MKAHQITIFDIARELQISKSTVSRALTNHPNVHQETRRKVLELANKLEYQRNMMAIRLATQKSNIIGIIVPEFISSYFPLAIIGIQEVATKAGYGVIISQSNECYETEVANAKVMLANQVDGMLISVTKETTDFDHLKIFERKGIPIVQFNRVSSHLSVPKVIVDDYEGAFSAVEYLIKSGRRRIAHFAGPKSLSISIRRLNGYLDALKKNNIDIDEDLIVSYDLDLEKVSAHTNRLLALKERPDAIFAVNDPTAIEIIQVIKKAGWQVPHDLAVIGFSNDYVSALISPPLTTVAQPVKEIGMVAAKLLLEQIKRDIGDWKASTTVLKTELIVRGST
ncbi:MAG: LacI family transcriptional regulator [Pedobacter sp.]|nr:MAG: LacI family transcriptional regulator [Pedobacter sp.]